MDDVTGNGVLSTASDLVFAGGREGYFFALDARTGALLWRSMLGGQIVDEVGRNPRPLEGRPSRRDRRTGHPAGPAGPPDGRTGGWLAE